MSNPTKFTDQNNPADSSERVDTETRPEVIAKVQRRANTPARRRAKLLKPEKPYPEFPLFAHATRRWAKKIKGRLVYFGPWADPQKALDKFLTQKDDLYSGRRPVDPDNVFTVEVLVNKFLAHKRHLLDTGELSPRSFRDYYHEDKEHKALGTCQQVIDLFGWDRPVTDLRPEDFAAYRVKVSKTVGPVTLGNEIQRVRSLFKYAFDAGHIAAPIRFGPGFKKPSKKTLRLHRAAQGPRMFQVDEIQKLLAAAGLQLKAMILLGINCGFGNNDCGTLPIAALELDRGWVIFPRPKAGIDRRCYLWPETVQALRNVLAVRKEPKDKAHTGLVFITKAGGSWAKDIADSPVTKEMRKLLNGLGINGHRNFYALRRTFETIGGASRDQVAVDYIMGHADDSMAASYREHIGDDRLRAVADHVRGWLFPPATHVSDVLAFTDAQVK
jgi:integrase